MLRFSRFTYHYPGHAEAAVQDLGFELAPGETLALLGPQGAGKSTVLKAAAGLLKDYGGQIELLGQPLEETDQSRYERVGLLFEDAGHLGKLTALENLEYFARFYQGPTEDPAQLLDSCRLGKEKHTPAEQLSPGLTQRLALARALVHRPDLLLLDQPGAHLDPERPERLAELLDRAKGRGAAVLLATDQAAWAQALADRVGFMDQGRLVLAEPLADLLAQVREEVALTWEEGGQTRRETFPMQGLRENPRFLELLGHRGLKSLHSSEPDLGRLFAQHTGRKLS